MKKIMLVFGTRPEAVKMCPLVKELNNRPEAQAIVCVTGQHRRLLDQALAAFHVSPDYDLAVMREGQTLPELTARILEGITPVLERERPDLTLVHGDTATAFAAALASYYLGIPVGHVAAGLRTYDLHAPYPEEFHRQAISALAAYHFAPTEAARNNLLREGRDEKRVFVTGNTVIDALGQTVRADFSHPELEWAQGSRLLFVTAHRRENIGEPLRRMLRAIRRAVAEHDGVKALYPVHPNPLVRGVAEAELSGCPRIHLIEPLDVVACHNIMARSDVILTDSGGMQEEALALGVPVLVMREKTERPEAVEGDGGILAGTGEAGIRAALSQLLEKERPCRAPAWAAHPYGDGTASRRIADFLCREREGAG